MLPSGVRLFWREAGDPTRPPLVWIHGGSVEDSSVMLPDVEPFLHRVRALLPDTRGHGRSQRFERPEDYGYGAKAADLVAWLDALGVPAALFGGVSMGGALSLWLAVHHAARVRGVFSISGPPYAPPEEDNAGGRPTGPWWPRAASTSTSTPMCGSAWATRPWPASRRVPSATPSCWRASRRHSVPSFLALLDETYSRSEWLADCARIRCPVQIVAGERDRFPTVEMSRRLAATIPGARLHVVAGGPHFPNRSHRAEVQGVMGAFLSSFGL